MNSPRAAQRNEHGLLYQQQNGIIMHSSCANKWNSIQRKLWNYEWVQYDYNNNPVQMMEKKHFSARCKVLDGLGVMLVVAIWMNTEPKKLNGTMANRWGGRGSVRNHQQSS